jgi:hypothetical protein
MRLTIRFLPIAALLLALGLPHLASAANDKVSLQAILVAASREPGESDRRLARYEGTLQRILRFESFQQLGSGRGHSALPGEGRINLGSGHSLSYRAEDAGKGRVRLKLQWQEGSRNLMRTGLVLRPGVPAVLGGPGRPDGSVYALLVIAQ